MFNMTRREANQRCAVHRARLYFCTMAGEYEVWLEEWSARKREAASYFTNDLEDAVLTAGAMRKQQDEIDARISRT